MSKISESTLQSKKRKIIVEDAVKNIIVLAKTENKDLTPIFGVISFWKYSKKYGTFICKESFTTSEIVPFQGGSQKIHN